MLKKKEGGTGASPQLNESVRNTIGIAKGRGHRNGRGKK